MGLPPNAPGPLPELCGSSGGFDFTSFLRSSLYLHRRSFLPSPASPPASNSPLPNTHAHTHSALPTFSPDLQPWTRPFPFPFSPCTASKRLPMGPEAWIPTWGRGPDASSGGGAGCESGSGAGCESGPGAGCESGGRMLKPALARFESGGRMLKPAGARFESGRRMLKPAGARFESGPSGCWAHSLPSKIPSQGVHIRANFASSSLKKYNLCQGF